MLVREVDPVVMLHLSNAGEDMSLTDLGFACIIFSSIHTFFFPKHGQILMQVVQTPSPQGALSQTFMSVD